MPGRRDLSRGRCPGRPGAFPRDQRRTRAPVAGDRPQEAGPARCEAMGRRAGQAEAADPLGDRLTFPARSEEHTSELQSLMRISYAVFFLKKKKNQEHERYTSHHY